MPPSRILMLSPSFEDQGGVADFCRSLMSHLSPSFEIEHFEIGNRPGNRNPVRRLSFFLRDVARLRRRLKSGSYDLVHLNPSLEILSLFRDSFYLFLAHRIHGMQSLIIFHGWNPRIARWLLMRRIPGWGFRRLYSRPGRVLALCSNYRDQLERMGLAPERLGIITTMYRAEENDAGYLKRDPSVPIRFLFMARLWKAKGVYVVVNIARLLVEKGIRDFRLVIAGDGPELEGIQRLRDKAGLGEHVLTPGYLRGDEKRAELKRSDIFLFPSFGEGCPVVILEAMGAGLAVVSTPVGAIPEIIENGVNGFLVDSCKAEDFIPAIEQLIANPGLLATIQASNSIKARENYEAAIVTAKIEAVYRSVISDRSGEDGQKNLFADLRENRDATGWRRGK